MLSLIRIFGWFQVIVHCSSALHHRAYSLERDAALGVEYSQVIDYSVQYVWRYSYDRRNRSQVLGDTFKVLTKVDQEASVHAPVFFAVRYLHQSMEWGLPMRSSSGRVYTSANRTLCSDSFNHPDYGYNDETTIQVTVSTRSREKVSYRLEIMWENNVVRSFGNSVKAHFSPSSPAQYRLAVPQASSSSRYSLLYITSSDNTCSTVTVQESYCSTGYNQPESFGVLPVQRIRSQNTMTRKSAVNIKREDLAKGNLLLTFTVHEDDSKCGSPTHKLPFSNNALMTPSYYPISSHDLISKSVEFTLLEKIGDDAYLFATSATFICLLIFCIGFGFLFWTRFRMVSVAFYAAQKAIQHQQQENPAQDGPCSQQPISLTMPPSTSNSEKEDLQDDDLCCMFFMVPTDYPQQRKHRSYLQDNCRKCDRDITKSTRRYVSTLSVVAAFYMLPVLQFVLLYQQVLNDTGDEDLCYYNFMCLHPLGNMTTFNHMFSNIGYVMLGLLFLLIVYVEQNRKIWDNNVEEVGSGGSGQKQEPEKGLQSHYGIFYAMGIALAMEGFMSAFYHICPNRLNYQFDMAFMYVVAVLCLVKLYQGRHPDSNASALMSYGSLALVVLLVAAGVLFQTWYFWFVITIIHFCVVFVMSLHLYSLGEWRIGWPALNKPENASYVLMSICHPFRKGNGWMTFFLILIVLTNLFAAGLGYVLFFKIHDIATHLVFVLLLNLLLYSLIYLFLKMKYREKLMWPTWLYMWLSIPFWFIGLYLFIFRRVDGWHLSQAESRSLNEECILWDFYDWHDIWHFLSAFGIFFMFMFFFTLDDDLRNVKRTNIKVF